MSGHCTSVLLFEVSTFSNERSLWRSSVCNNNHDNHDYHDYHDYRDNQDSQICELFQLSAHFRRLQFVALCAPIKTRLENQISFCFCLNIFKNVKYWSSTLMKQRHPSYRNVKDHTYPKKGSKSTASQCQTLKESQLLEGIGFKTRRKNKKQVFIIV